MTSIVPVSLRRVYRIPLLGSVTDFTLLRGNSLSRLSHNILPLLVQGECFGQVIRDAVVSEVLAWDSLPLILVGRGSFRILSRKNLGTPIFMVEQGALPQQVLEGRYWSHPKRVEQGRGEERLRRQGAIED